MAFKLVATHKPTGEVEEFGPWEAPAEPQKAVAVHSYALGFVHGLFTKHQGVGFDPADLEVAVVPVGALSPNHLSGALVAEASATVTRADGTVA